MNILKKLWTDQTGAVLSAEVVTVGTVAVLGSALGLGMLSTAVNDELAEMAIEVRGFEQGVTVVHPSSPFATGGMVATPNVQGQSKSPLNPAQQAVLQEYQSVRAANESPLASQVALQTSNGGAVVVDTPDGKFEIRRVAE